MQVPLNSILILQIESNHVTWLYVKYCISHFFDYSLMDPCFMASEIPTQLLTKRKICVWLGWAVWPNLQQPAAEHASTLSFHLWEDRKIVFTSFIPVRIEKTWGERGMNILHRNFVTSKLCPFELVQNEIHPRSAGWQTNTWTLLLHWALAGFKFHLPFGSLLLHTLLTLLL